MDIQTLWKWINATYLKARRENVSWLVWYSELQKNPKEGYMSVNSEDLNEL